MWGAIIQAIDHAAGRINSGAGAGIEVAKATGGSGTSSKGGNVTDMSNVGTKISPSEVKGLVDNISTEEEEAKEEE